MSSTGTVLRRQEFSFVSARACFDCKSFKDNGCQLLRAQYEHKRQRIQDQRYKQDLDASQKEEGRKLPFEE